MNLRIFQAFDWSLFIIPILLVTSGIAVIYSITQAQPGSNFTENQIIFFLLGMALLLFFTFFDYRSLKSFSVPVYFLGILLLILVTFLGRTTFGATRWIDLGFFQLQPAEIFKFILILFLAKFISDYNELGFRHFLVALISFFIPFILIVRQPDIGTSSVILVLFFVILMISKIPKIFIISLLIFIIILLPFAWIFSKGYQRERIYTFFSPSRDPFGSGYNVLQSQIAVGSGGLLGRGLGKGTQSSLQFLPVAHTDFIFAGWAESTGFVGSTLMVLIFTILILRMINVAKTSRDEFGALLSAGILTMFLFQLLVNVGMNLGIMPVTGIPLPLVSYGGSSLLTNMIALGVLQSIYLRHKKIRF